MPAHGFFYLGLILLLLHEMDAMRCQEWRIFPGLALLDDKRGMPAFLLAHVPLYFLILLCLGSETRRDGFIEGLSWFMVVHAGLHLLFLLHPRNQFRDWLSWTIIAGAALAGAAELVLE